MAKKIITNLHELVSDASSAYIYANKEEFKSTIPGAQGLRGLKGEDGIDGTSVTINNVQNNIDKSITIVFSDGTVHTTDPLKGKDGTNITVTNVTNNSSGTLTIDFSDGTSHTTKDLTGPRGFKGDTGDHVHHISYQRSKDSLGNDIGPTTPSRRGYTDIYSMWASQEELPEMFIGNFSVYNGLDTLSAEDTFKFDSIEFGATADQEAFEVPYDNTISGLLSEDVQNSIDELSATKLNILEKGQPNGVAPLDSNGLVSSTYLPSYVDDVLEVDTKADLPISGEHDKIYIVVSDETSNGDTSSYRWTGTVYAMVSNTLNATDVKALYESNVDTNVYTDAEKTKLAGIIDDTTASILTAYSSTKVQEMHNAQAATMAALGTAQGEIANTNTPVFASIPKYPLVGVLDFTTVIGSTNTSMFEIDATNNLFAFKQAASYTFLSEVVIKSNVSAARVLTFNLVDSDTDVVLMTQSKNMIVARGNTENFSISTLLMIDVAPKNVRVEVSCSDTGYEFRSFNSILTSSVGVGSESVDSIDTALGALVTEVLV